MIVALYIKQGCLNVLYIFPLYRSANILVLLREEAFRQELGLAVQLKYMVDATVCGVGNSG